MQQDETITKDILPSIKSNEMLEEPQDPTKAQSKNTKDNDIELDITQ